jgi:hypothetical protein
MEVFGSFRLLEQRGPDLGELHRPGGRSPRPDFGLHGDSVDLVFDVDLGNSAHLSSILPAGVPWTSESGVFLSAVPEPGTCALLAAGMLCLGTVRRIRGASVRADPRSLREGSGPA